MTGYAERRDALARGLREARDGGPVRLEKSTSNLFRDRAAAPLRRLDVRGFNHVLEVNAAAGWVDAEGMTPYAALADATLAHGAMPCVVPQLKSITIGGAVAGVGIESSSFRHGLVHESVLELEVLLADGSVVLARPDNAHRDLFFGFPNSYGTLGYALRVKARTTPVKRFVRLEHVHHADPAAFFGNLAAVCASPADFVDGVAFGTRELVTTVGRFVDEAPYASDYTYQRIYYRSLRERDEDYLAIRDYLWRWDTDWFWCSKNLYAQNPLVRRLLGPRRLNSVFYAKVMRWNSRVGLTRLRDRMFGLHPESVIQDVDIPVDRAPEFLDFFQREIGILPVWICPFRARDPAAAWTLFPARPDTLYVNFGFWDVVRAREAHSPGHFNRLVERKVAELGGIKSLYSESFFPPDEFWTSYGGDAYRALKARYDPGGRLPDLYEKCVLRR
ncbi:MAG TPA: FAD-binding oxidoreductase [Burkholderiales bacterium]|nr:FAD-binding oxidoreductase [Burkholderiales bacterium]